MESIRLQNSSDTNLLIRKDSGMQCPNQTETPYCSAIHQSVGYYARLDWTLDNFNKFVNPLFRVEFFYRD